MFWIFCLVLAVAPSAKAVSPQESFEQANQYYFSRNFPEAIRAYQQVEAQGVHSGDLYYNLANSYYRQGEIGEAIYYYLTALRYSPRDRDLVANYRYVLSKRAEGYERSVGERAIDLLFFLKDLLTLREMLWLALASYWLLFTAALLYYMKRRQPWRVALIVLALLNLYILPVAFEKFREERLAGVAVAVEPSVSVYSEPNAESIRLFELREGAIAKVKDEREGFVKIQYRSGQIGWAKSDQLKLLSRS